MWVFRSQEGSQDHPKWAQTWSKQNVNVLTVLMCFVTCESTSTTCCKMMDGLQLQRSMKRENDLHFCWHDSSQSFDLRRVSCFCERKRCDVVAHGTHFPINKKWQQISKDFFERRFSQNSTGLVHLMSFQIALRPGTLHWHINHFQLQNLQCFNSS